MYNIILYKGKEGSNITDLVSDLSWSENMDTVGVSISFSVPDTNERYIPRLLIMAGDIVVIKNDSGELIRAIIISVTRNHPKRIVKAHDFGFYLNKNEVVVQFKDKSVSECLKELFYKVGISIGSICDMPAKVNAVYIKNVNEIIKELIELQKGNDGKKYYYELRGKDIYVFQLSNEPIRYTFKPAINVAAFDVTDKDAHSRGKYTHSIENMKNHIIAKVSSKGDDKLPSQQFIAKDNTNISKYGMLSEVYSINSDESDNIQHLAENELKQKNTVSRELSMDFIGHDKARPGRVMHIRDEYLGIDDNYRIESVSHKVSGGIHTMKCTLIDL